MSRTIAVDCRCKGCGNAAKEVGEPDGHGGVINGRIVCYNPACSHSYPMSREPQPPDQPGVVMEFKCIHTSKGPEYNWVPLASTKGLSDAAHL